MSTPITRPPVSAEVKQASNCSMHVSHSGYDRDAWQETCGIHLMNIQVGSRSQSAVNTPRLAQCCTAASKAMGKWKRATLRYTAPSLAISLVSGHWHPHYLRMLAPHRLQHIFDLHRRCVKPTTHNTQRSTSARQKKSLSPSTSSCFCSQPEAQNSTVHGIGNHALKPQQAA